MLISFCSPQYLIGMIHDAVMRMDEIASHWIVPDVDATCAWMEKCEYEHGNVFQYYKSLAMGTEIKLTERMRRGRCGRHRRSRRS